MQFSIHEIFLTTTKMLLTTHWSIFELRFDTVGLLVWDIRHNTKLFITSFYFFKEEKKLPNRGDYLAEK